MDQNVQDFVQTKRLAVVGVSRDPKKFGNTIYKELKERGFQVFAVNPSLDGVGGDPCYPSLAVLKGKVDGAVVCVQPARVGEVLQEAAQLGLRYIWLQRGAESPEGLAAARDLGLNPVIGKCILMYAPPVRSVHGFHRFFVKLFGKL